MLVLWLVLATVPLWIARVGLYPYLGIEILIWSLYALAFNLVLGTAGLPSFGHGAYFGIGAYAFGLCQFNVVANLWVCLAGGLRWSRAGRRAGGAVHLAPARHLLCLHDDRVRSDLLDAGDQVAQGHRRRGRPVEDRAAAGRFRRRVVRSRRQCRVLLFRAGRVRARRRSALWRLVHSPYGRVVAAIRQSETRAAHLGYNVWLYKASIFTLSAAVSGFAGGLFAMAQLAAFPDVMSLHQSGYVVMMTLVGGGLVSFWGPVVGVFLFLIARDVIGALTNAWMLYFGLLFIAVVLFRPEGIAGASPQRRRSTPLSAWAQGIRRCGCCSEAGDGADRSRRHPCPLRRPRRAGKHRSRGGRRRIPRRDGAERRRQDHVLQRADRPGEAEPRSIRLGGEDVTASARTGSPPRASRARSRS